MKGVRDHRGMNVTQKLQAVPESLTDSIGYLNQDVYFWWWQISLLAIRMIVQLENTK